MRNNYDKDVFNGDMGYIKDVDLIEQQVTVEIDGRAAVGYEFSELDELVHAYAISVHKSQGSEFPAVVIPLLTSHYMLLQRNLLYTAVTRAKRLVVLVGQLRAIGMAAGKRQGRAALQRTDGEAAACDSNGDYWMSNERPSIAVQLYSLRHVSDSFEEVAGAGGGGRV